MNPSDPIFPKPEETKSSSYTPPGATPAKAPKDEHDGRPEEPAKDTSPAAEPTEAEFLGAPNESKPMGQGLAITSLVLGLFGVICCSCCGIPTGLAGIIFAVIDRVRRGRFDPLALTGLITSIVSILLCAVSLAIFFFLGIMDGLLDDGMVIPPAAALFLWR